MFLPCSAASGLPSATNIPPARVVIIQDPDATEAFQPHPDRIRAMVERGLTNLTGKTSAAESWRSILGTNGVISSNDVIGIKVFSKPGPNSGTHPEAAAALVEGLLAAGIAPNHIVVWDKQAVDLRLAGFFDLADRYGIRVAGSAQAGYDEKTAYANAIIGNLAWGDLEFGKKETGVGRKSFVSNLLTHDITRIINLSPLLNHNEAGVSGNLYSLASGSVDNFARFESGPERLAVAVPEIYALPALSDRVVLNVVDALVCQYEGSDRGLLHYATVLNQVRFSRDPLALDILSLEEIKRQRALAKGPEVKTSRELYDNAALLELGVNNTNRIHIDTLQLER